MTDHNLLKVSPRFCDATNDFLNIHFDTPDMAVIQDAMAKCHASHHTECVQGMHIIGDSGTGKTYNVEDYANNYPRYFDDGQEIVPVLYVSLLEKTTSKAFIKRTLRTLTGLRKISGDEEEIQDRLVNRLRAAKTELIIIDEAQHLTRESSYVSAQHAADAIKTLMDYTKIPVICVGIDSSLALLMGKSKFKKEKQLKRRNRRLFALRAYDIGSDHWSDLICQYQAALNCKKDLTSDEMLKRLYVATSGLFGSLTPLFKEAIEITGDAELIDREVLEKAYIEFQPENELTFNPFKASMSTVEAEITHRLGAQSESTATEKTKGAN